MSVKYGVQREGEVRLFTVKDEQMLDASLNAGVIQNHDIIYRLVPVGFVAAGVFNKAPDAEGDVLARWDGKKVAAAPLYTAPLYKIEASNG